MKRIDWISIVLALATFAIVCSGCDRPDSNKPSPPARSTADPDDNLNSLGADDPVLRHGDATKPPPLPEAIPAVVATVNGTKIPRTELMDAVVMRYEIETHARQTLIYAKALERCLTKRNLSVTPEEIDQETTLILNKEGKTLEQFVGERKFTNDYLRRQVYYRVGIQKLAFAAGFSTAPKELTAQANAKADRLLFEDNLIKWRWMGIPDSAWVTINGEEVSLDEAYRWSVTWRSLWDVMKILNELVAAELEREAIRDQKVEIPQDEFNQLMSAQAAAAQQTGNTMEERSRFIGVSVPTVEDRTRRALGLRTMLRALAADERLTAYLEAQGPEKGGYGPAAHVSEIAIQPANGDWDAAEKKARDAIARIKNGESFSDVARSESTDPNLRNRGGDRGWIPISASSGGAIESRAAKLELNVLSEPFRTEDSVHVIRVDSRRAGTTAKQHLEDPTNRKKAVDDFVRDEKKPWHLRMKRQAKIEVFLGS